MIDVCRLWTLNRNLCELSDKREISLSVLLLQVYLSILNMINILAFFNSQCISLNYVTCIILFLQKTANTFLEQKAMRKSYIPGNCKKWDNRTTP